MPRRCLCWLLMILVVLGQSAGMQVVAWSGMLVQRGLTDGFDRALVSTFSGDQPCTMCKALQNAEKSPTAPTPTTRKTMDVSGQAAVLIEPVTADRRTVGWLEHLVPVMVRSPWSGVPEPPPPCSA